MSWGIDIGSRKAALVRYDGSQFSDFTITVPKLPTRGEELRRLVADISSLVTDDEGVFVEEPPYVNNRRVFMSLAQTHGALLSALATDTRRAYGVSVSEWKKHTVGSGSASKNDVRLWLRRVHPGYSSERGDQDIIDASCIAIYGHQLEERS